MNAGNVLGFIWTLVAAFFVLSVVAAPVFLLIRKARARGKRLFVDEPTARVRALHRDTSGEHIYDA